MQINKNTGLIEGIDYSPSPNADERPQDLPIDLIVIHSISLPPGQYGNQSIEQFFTNQLDASQHPYFSEIADMQVSAHLLITRDGRVIQFVPFHMRAWHAGVSNYCGREKCNDFSIGIELEGTDDTPFEEIQYVQLADVVNSLCRTYVSLTDENITGHSDIAPGRKTDPGKYFDWAKLKQLLNT